MGTLGVGMGTLRRALFTLERVSLGSVLLFAFLQINRRAT